MTMITPKFRCEQNENKIFIIIIIKNVKLLQQNDLNNNNFEIYHNENEFIFYLKPYYLRLQFSNELISSDDFIDQNNQNDKRIDYNLNTNELTISVEKKIPGQHFENLELNELLLSSNSSNGRKMGKKLIEVIKSEINEISDDEEDEEFDWKIEQTISTDDDIKINKQPYGFANCFTDYNIQDNDLFDIKMPSMKTIKERRVERLKKEFDDFNEDYYLANLYDDNEIIDSIIKLSLKKSLNLIIDDNDRQYLIDNNLNKINQIDHYIDDKKAIILGLFDILFGYCYDLRTNDFEHTIESPWTIIKLSSCLSCFEYYQTVNYFDNDDILNLMNINDITKLLLINCIRRSLIYPLYRNWNLSIQIIKDVIEIFSLGSNAILKCLIDIHKIMSSNNNYDDDDYNLINELYINQYCCWIQKYNNNNKLFKSLSNYLSNLINNKIDKNLVALDLILIEKAAQLAIEEKLTNGIKSILNISSNISDSDDDD